MNDEIALPDQPEPSGERYIPTLMSADVAVEHWHRYAMTARFVADKRVLDIASGEGYGSMMLAETAATVLGVDIDAVTVVEARRRYNRNNLKFSEGSCTAMPLPDASVDVVVSFETLEHHDQHEEMLCEIRRVLVPDGLCILSTPDRIVYSERSSYCNTFHVKELSDSEFRALVFRHFHNAAFLGQKYVRGSLLTGTNAGFHAFQQEHFGVPPEAAPYDPKYLVAVASDAMLPEISASIIEDSSGDREVARLTKLIEDTVTQLMAVIVDRDHYKQQAEDQQATSENQRIIRMLQETVENLIVDRDHYRRQAEGK